MYENMAWHRLPLAAAAKLCDNQSTSSEAAHEGTELKFRKSSLRTPGTRRKKLPRVTFEPSQPINNPRLDFIQVRSEHDKPIIEISHFKDRMQQPRYAAYLKPPAVATLSRMARGVKERQGIHHLQQTPLEGSYAAYISSHLQQQRYAAGWGERSEYAKTTCSSNATLHTSRRLQQQRYAAGSEEQSAYSRDASKNSHESNFRAIPARGESESRFHMPSL